ncbi:MAG TPA: TlpA disulfide reductase family protein [Solirubrobacterales bacterium]|nr:TlpA disulfide reductase family protein [Solirubrobacterales bacterium]
MRGKPALVNFWASWCGPCREEAPELERFDRSLHGTARLVGVDYTDGETPPASTCAATAGPTQPPRRHLRLSLPISGFPTTLVLDPRGRIVERLNGPQTVASLHAAVDRFLG